MSSQEKKDTPPEEQFIKFPMLAFWQLRDLNESDLKVLLYIQRHTRNFEVNRRILSTDEIMNGRKLKGGGRMDQGTGLSNRSVIDSIRRLESRRLLFPADEAHGQKSYATVDCPPLTQLMKKVHRPKVKQGRVPVKKVHKPYENGSQVPMNNVHKSYEESTQAAPGEPRPQTGRHDSTDTLTEHFRDTLTDTSAASAKASPPLDIDIEKEEENEGDARTRAATISNAPPAPPDAPASPFEPTSETIAASTTASGVGAALPAAELTEEERLRREAQANYHALYPEYVKLSGQWGTLVRAVQKMEPDSLEYDRASAEAAAYQQKVDEMLAQLRTYKRIAKGG